MIMHSKYKHWNCEVESQFTVIPPVLSKTLFLSKPHPNPKRDSSDCPLNVSYRNIRRRKTIISYRSSLTNFWKEFYDTVNAWTSFKS